MSKTCTVVLAVILGLVLAPASRADEKTLQLGKKHEGEIGGKATTFGSPLGTGIGAEGTLGAGFPLIAYQAMLKVDLKPGQEVSITGEVLGDDRKIQLALFNPVGKPIRATKVELKEATLTLKQAPATGRYTVLIGSDQVGAFTLKVVVAEKDSAEALEKRIEELEKELKELKAKLKEIRSKSP